MADRPMTVRDLARYKQEGRKLVMVSAYDALFGGLAEQGGVDIVLVGDSVNTVLCGEETTLSATLDQMIYHGRIVRRGVRRALVVIDMPFLSYQISPEEARRNCGRALKETGAPAVKLEGGAPVTATVRALTDIGIPVMAHLGFTPQAVHALGGPRVQGRDANAAERLLADARALEDAGAFALVLELVPSGLARAVTEALTIPTIGIGSGVHCDGQVLVLPDLLGLNEQFRPKFLKRYAELAEDVRDAVRRFGDDVRGGRYPDADHSFDT